MKTPAFEVGQEVYFIRIPHDITKKKFSIHKGIVKSIYVFANNTIYRGSIPIDELPFTYDIEVPNFLFREIPEFDISLDKQKLIDSVLIIDEEGLLIY